MWSRPSGGGSTRMPSVFYNLTTLIGISISALSLLVIIFLFALELLTHEPKPYMGILAFVVFPATLLLGLGMAGLGALRQHYRKRAGLPRTQQLPSINLNQPAHRRMTAIIAVGTLILILATTFGSFKAYEATDSDAFCGTTCHEVMTPEYVAYRNSPHARVGCVKCHIGEGATWFIRSKLSGTYQVYSVLFDKYDKPLETPLKNLRPSRDTCEKCHWPKHFWEQKLVSRDYYLSDEENTHTRIGLLMRIGGGGPDEDGSAGIHWHMNIENEVDYITTDEKRREIPWIRTRSLDGVETIYRSTENETSDEELLAQHELRRMDCLDCHNRPSHQFDPPARDVNKMISHRKLQDLPHIKETAVDALEAGYETTEEAMIGIDIVIRSFYEKNYPDLADSDRLNSVIEATQDIYSMNYFPSMAVNWTTFPDNIGHLYSQGCFRCHDGKHVSDDGSVLSKDCNACHTILTQESNIDGQRIDLGGVEFIHPEDIDEEWRETDCSECHGE